MYALFRFLEAMLHSMREKMINLSLLSQGRKKYAYN